MLASFEIHLRPHRAIPMDRHVGRWINGLVYDLVGQADPGLAAQIHAGSSLRPFTCSALQGPMRMDRGKHHATPDATYRVRITTLTRELYEALGPIVLQLYVRRGDLEIGPATAQLTSVSVSPHSDGPWIGVTSYGELLRTAANTLTIPIEFATPTAFKRGSEHLLFPEPGLVFGSLHRTWHTFAPSDAAIDLDDDFAERIRVTRYTLRTDAIEAGRYKLIGFTGRCSYRIQHNDLVLAHKLNALAAAARFLGVGAKTTQGMGQARGLQEGQ